MEHIAKVFNEEIHQGIVITEETRIKIRNLFDEELKIIQDAKN